MFTRIRNSWELVVASAVVLRADKELIVFPILSSIGVLVVTASFALPMVATGLLGALFEGRLQILGILVGFAFYAVQYFVIIFSTSALVGAAMIRLRGGNPTVGDGFRIAMEHIGPITSYVLIAATVGLLLRWLSERVRFAGGLLAAIGGLAWTLATYLVVPILVVEDVGPLEAIRRSASLLKKTWGEQIVGNLGIGVVFGLLTVGVIVLGIVALVLVISTGSLAAIALTGVLFVLALVFLGLIQSTLSGIYTAAVYRYAAEGQTSAFFSEEMLEGAFRPK
jgi:hypothetical protein